MSEFEKIHTLIDETVALNARTDLHTKDRDRKSEAKMTQAAHLALGVLERLVTAQERQATALERIAKSLGPH